MGRVGMWLLVVVVVVATYVGMDALRRRWIDAATTVEVSRKIDGLRAEAERQHPGMAKTDALKMAAAEETARTLDGLHDPGQRTGTAAGMFFGYYYLNTEARVAYCKQRSVDITPFVSAFAKAHQHEFSRAQAIFTKANVDPESMIPALMPTLASMVDQDMKDVAAGAKVPLDQACGLFNEHADFIVEQIKLPPHVKQALLAED